MMRNPTIPSVRSCSAADEQESGSPTTTNPQGGRVHDRSIADELSHLQPNQDSHQPNGRHPMIILPSVMPSSLIRVPAAAVHPMGEVKMRAEQGPDIHVHRLNALVGQGNYTLQLRGFRGYQLQFPSRPLVGNPNIVIRVKSVERRRIGRGRPKAHRATRLGIGTPYRPGPMVRWRQERRWADSRGRVVL